MPVNIVITVDVVQFCHHKSARKKEKEVSSLVTNSPKKHDCRHSPEKVNTWTTLVLEVCSPRICARKC